MKLGSSPRVRRIHGRFFGATSSIWRAQLYGSFLAIPPITVPFFFLLPLCQTFLDGVAGGRKMLLENSNTTPWQEFRRILVPSVLLWLVLWLSYLVALELMMSFRFGGGNWIASGVCVTLVLGLFSGCVMWAPSCQSLGGLALSAVVWTLAAFVTSIAIAVALITLFDAGGYMGLGYLFAPVGAAGVMLAFSIACGFYVLLRRDTWFDETRK